MNLNDLMRNLNEYNQQPFRNAVSIKDIQEQLSQVTSLLLATIKVLTPEQQKQIKDITSGQSQQNPG